MKAKGARSLRVSQFRSNHLPALLSFLYNQSHVDLPRWRDASVDHAHQDGGITKDSDICIAHRRSPEATRTGVLWNDVMFTKHLALEVAADEIVRDYPA